MKKVFIFCFLFIFCYALIDDCRTNSIYNSSDTISLDSFLQLKKSRRDWKKLKLNENGDVIFKEKVIITNSGQPINDTTSADSYLSLKIFLLASGAQPRKGCDTKDYYKNGIYGLGCYIDSPDE